MTKTTCLVPIALLLLAMQQHSLAGSATWSSNPASSDWNTAANWMPNTVPNGSSDIATFGASNITALSVNITVELETVVFDTGATPFTITSGAGTNLSFTGEGVVNNSGAVQSLVKVPNGLVIFYNNASAGEMTSLSGVFFVFYDQSSAGSAAFDITSSGIYQAELSFWDSSSAANATIIASEVANVGVYEDATAANATFTLNS